MTRCTAYPPKSLMETIQALREKDIPWSTEVFDCSIDRSMRRQSISLTDGHYMSSRNGDIVDTVASSLRIYLPELKRCEPEIDFTSLVVGDLIKLPPWDDAICGTDFPKTEQQLVNLPPAPPPPPAQNAPSSVVGQSDNENVVCDAYRFRANDTIFSVASTFSIPVRVLMEYNPDIAGGAPVVEGTIIKLTDKENCDEYNIQDGLSTIESFLGMSPPPPPPVPIGPVRVGAISEDNPMTFEETNSTTLTSPDPIDVPETEKKEPSREWTIVQNIVSDAPASVEENTDASSGPGVGVYIMIGFLAAIIIIVLISMTIAISNSKKRHGMEDTVPQDASKYPPV
eukprot:jgi/Picre1/28686/NNA_004086.t1